jgi:hypothetical protein
LPHRIAKTMIGPTMRPKAKPTQVHIFLSEG